ncbi:MAG: nitrile hydratase subunit alpha [Actinoplanes sp.]
MACTGRAGHESARTARARYGRLLYQSGGRPRTVVVPMQPAGTEDWPEDRLSALVTRDSMIGVTIAEVPRPVSR